MTPRQTEVVALLLDGCNAQEIGAQLHIKTGTVKAALQRVFHEYGISGRRKSIALMNKLYVDGGEKQEASVSLYPRLRQLLPLVAEGRTNREIAEHFGTTEDTTKNQVQDLFDALGMSSRLEVALWAKTHTLSEGAQP